MGRRKGSRNKVKKVCFEEPNPTPDDDELVKIEIAQELEKIDEKINVEDLINFLQDNNDIQEFIKYKENLQQKRKNKFLKAWSALEKFAIDVPKK